MQYIMNKEALQQQHRVSKDNHECDEDERQ